MVHVQTERPHTVVGASLGTVRRAGERARLQIGSRTAHVEHASHVRDAGRCEADPLVEGRCALPRRSHTLVASGGHKVCGERAAGCGLREVRGGRRLGSCRGCSEERDCRLGGRTRGGAHPEHVAHVRDAGRIEADQNIDVRVCLRNDRLVELLCVLQGGSQARHAVHRGAQEARAVMARPQIGGRIAGRSARKTSRSCP